MPTQANGTAAQLVFDVLEFTVGLGIFVMALSPLAIPAIVIVLVPLLVIALIGALASAVVALPLIVLLRSTRPVREALRDRSDAPRVVRAD